MMRNLKAKLEQRGITIKAYAGFLGISESSVQNKIRERTDFTYPEIKKTKAYLFPEYDVDYLFASDSDEPRAG